MANEINIRALILFLACFQGILFAILFFFRSAKREMLSDLLMGLFLIEGTLLILPYMLGFLGISIMWDELLFFPMNPGLLIGPTIYFYLVTLTNTDFKFQRKDLLHLLPFALYTIYHLAIYVQGKLFVQTWMAEVDLPYVATPLSLLTLISNYVYISFTIKYYYRYKKWVETEFSNPEDINFSWYRNYLFLIVSGITMSWVFTALNDLGFQLDYTQNWWEFFFIGIILYIVSISAYTRAQVIYLQFRPEEKIIPETNKSNLELAELREWKEKVSKLMKEEKAFLSPQLSLSQMAGQIGIPSPTLSQVINEGFGKNFNDFVNEFRVEEVKRLISDPSKAHLSLLGIAYESGFNSKATFNRTFKKFAGMTPSAFLSSRDSKKPENKRTFAPRLEVL
ncbi:MAG: helix-turn-helix domain-containing protein [Bacteroidota bacterium]